MDKPEPLRYEEIGKGGFIIPVYAPGTYESEYMPLQIRGVLEDIARHPGEWGVRDIRRAISYAQEYFRQMSSSIQGVDKHFIENHKVFIYSFQGSFAIPEIVRTAFVRQRGLEATPEGINSDAMHLLVSGLSQWESPMIVFDSSRDSSLERQILQDYDLECGSSFSQYGYRMRLGIRDGKLIHYTTTGSIVKPVRQAHEVAEGERVLLSNLAKERDEHTYTLLAENQGKKIALLRKSGPDPAIFFLASKTKD